MMFKNKTMWIVVADGARARIFKKNGQGWVSATGIDYASENLKDKDMITDRAGRFANNSPHSYEPSVDHHQRGKSLFIKGVCDILNDSESQYDELVIVSPPRVIGDLREHMSKKSKAKVRSEIQKDLTQLSVGELIDHLQYEM